MATKLQQTFERLQATLNSLSSYDEWTNFLKTAAWMYKYPFLDQVLIYAQRPDATACASIDIWNKSLQRWINKGAKGIALLHESGGMHRLDYVFDVSDTNDRYGRDIVLWKYENRHDDAIIETLQNTFGDSDDTILVEAIRSAAHNAVQDNKTDYLRDLQNLKDDSLLSGLDNENLDVRFSDLAESSIAYMIMQRMGIENAEELFSAEDFPHIMEFSTSDTISVLGSAVQSVSETALRSISETIRAENKKFAFERMGVYNQSRTNIRDDNERNDKNDREVRAVGVHDSGRLSAAEPDSTGQAVRDREIRTDETDISQEPPEGTVHSDAGEGNTAPALGGHEQGSDGDGREDSVEAGTDRGSDGGAESPEPIDMDRLNEQLSPFSRGDGTEGRGVQLNLFDMSLPSEEEQRNSIEAEQNGSAFKMRNISQQMIDEVLTSGANDQNSVLNICVQYSKNKSAEDNIEFLKREYGIGGKGFIIDGTKVAAWWDDKGIKIARGDRAVDSFGCELITWDEADMRIRELLDIGRYAAQTTLDKMRDYELSEAVSAFWYMHQDLNYDDYPQLRDLFDPEWFRGGFPDSTARIAELMRTPEGVDRLIAAVSPIAELHSENKDVMRFRMYLPGRILTQLTDLQRERLRFTADEYQGSTASRFITEDELDDMFIKRGSGISDGKLRIYLYFKEHTDKKERTDFLKNEYGVSGYLAGLFSQESGNKGITFSRSDILSPLAKVELSWNAVEKRIDKLIKSGKYLSERELNVELPRYQSEIEQQRIRDEKIEYLRNMNGLTPEERRDTLPKRIAYFTDIISEYEKRYFEEYGVQDLIGKTEIHISDAIKDADTRQNLIACMDKINGATTDVYVRNSAHQFSEELSELKVLQIYKVGRDYEMYGDDAIAASEILGIRTTQKEIDGVSVAVITMPQHNIDHYMEKLYNENIFVDISNKPVDNERYATVSRDLALELFQAGHKVYEYDNGELSVIRSEDGIRYYNGFLMIDNPVLLDRAQTLISDFYEQEYGDESADFSNLHKVSLAYTTTEDGASEIQVDADLVDYRIIKYLDNHEVEREQFKDLYDMVENGLSDLNFDELVFMYESDIAAVIPEQDEQDISLAEQLVNFVREYNYYEYMDNLDVGSDHSDLVNQMSSELQSRENVQSLIESIKGSLPEYEEDDEYLERANSLISQLDGLLNQSQEYDIGFGSLGNGTTVWNRLEEVNGDYKTIAHIEDNGDVKYYEELPDDVKQRIERQAEFEKAIYQSINSDTPQRTRRNTEQINYDILTELAPELMDGDARYMRFQDKAMMPLIVEKLSDTRVSVAHTYILNGDVMYDPEMEFEIDRNTRSLSPRTYRQDDMGIYQYAELENGLLNTAFVTQFNSFARTWFKNIENTNYVRENATIEFNGEDISISYDENGNIAEISGDEEAVQQYKAEHPIPETAPEPEQHNDNNLIGKEVIMGERKFVVENINNDNVSLRDLTFEQSAGFPIFRNESLDTVRGLITEQGQETEHESEAEQHTEAIPMPQQQRPKPVSNTVIYPEITGERHNFRITDDNLGVAGPTDKFRNNVAAIELLHMLEEEHRLATPEEQEILSRYVGWGGLADAFDSEKDSWHSEYTQLKSLLTEAEYNSARESTLTAFYTPPVVIRSMYDALEGMGLKQANILDPSMGIGNFEGMLPDSLSECKMYGIEIDSISGRIAQQLYQNNSVAIQGYEDSALPDSFFDAAVGNVPFGQFKVMDKRYDKHNFLIHDYFFAKTIDKVRPGGVIAFVTSSGTMDKRNSNVRKYIAQRAELIGAIRLPDNTFKANAGTEVTSDILFLQKRDRMTDIEPDWVHLDTDEQGHTMNSYFVSNPDMILGEMVEESGPFGPQLNCKAYEGADLGEQLNDAIQNIHAQITEYDIEDVSNDEDLSIPADPSVRNFSYTVVDGDIYFRENSRMNKVDVSLTAQNRIKGLIEIRDCVRELIEYQSEDYPEHEIKAQQDKLNKLYDEYTAKYGLINSRGNNMAFSNDSSYFLLCSLEIINENGELERKADMFTKRTIGARTEITHVDTASEALAVSIGEKARVDMEYMSELTGMTEQELFEDLKGVVFLNPLYASGVSYQEKYLPADEYLSGNVREKLLWAQRSAELYPEDYSVNVEALTAVQPKDLTASEITVRLGTTWIPPEYIKEFVSELLKPSYFASRNIDIKYSNITGTWAVTGKNYDKMNVMANSTYGTKRANAYSIIEDSLNLKDVRIFDYVENEKGNRVAVLNQKETTIAQQKQDLIKNAFDNWIWSDPDRRMALTKLYNERFNSVRPREYDGSHIQFSGMNPEIQLRQHQKNAVARIMYGGNSLLGHVVGAGKTWTMAAAAMEMKRLGLCNKSLFVVPNHLTEQWAAEFLQLYPAANILVATKKDFETKNRKKFCGRIATGDYDAIIIGHSQFEKIPMSIERQIKMLENQRDEIIDGIIEAKANRDERFTIKQLEKTKRGIEAKLKKLNDTARKDDVVTFEELGVDRLFVDESHYYKNLYLYTKMRNVGGIAQTEAQKSSDMFMKCRYLDEITGGKGCIMATGTPISNSMVEMYTVQRYLQYDTLVRNELQHFDAWASTFGETVTAIELAPEGSGYRAKTRFAKFFNLPELMTMFKEVADIQTADMLKLPVPEAEYHNVAVQPTEIQKEMVSDLSDRAEKVRNRAVDPSVDNMLKITNDGRKLALDQRMINPMLADEEETKVNACMNNVYEIWKRTAADRSAQLVFCDLSTPKGEDEFSVYTDIKAKLIAKGVPENEIAFIHDADTDVKKKELFSKVRKGDVRILLGSTQKMGAGTNVQTRLIALHDLDCRATRS